MSPRSPAPDGVPIKPFFTPRTVAESVRALPAQILFAIAGLFGLAHYARAIVRAAPRRPGWVDVGRARRGAAGLSGESDGDASDGERDVRVTVNEWINENVPLLKGSFTPAWWLPNGHLQTLWTVMADFSTVDQVEYERTYLRVPDGGTISLDFAPPHHAALAPDTPTVVVCHGLTGGSHESYVRNVLAWAVRPPSAGGLGARAVVVNFRGCAGTPLTTPQFYSAGTTVDLETAAHYLRATFPRAPLLGLGFSLGAAVMARHLGQAGASSLLSAALVLGCPWDLPAMSRRLEDGWFTPRVYSRALGANLLRLFRRHFDANPALFRHAASPVRDLLDTLLDMDRGRAGPVRLRKVDEVMVTKLGGPHEPGSFPFDSADDYYAWASPNKVVHEVKVPLLSINAFDDPVVVGDALPLPEIHASSHVYAAITGAGGHLGWFDGPLCSSAGRKRRWVLAPASEFLAAAARLPPRGEVGVERGPARSGPGGRGRAGGRDGAGGRAGPEEDGEDGAGAVDAGAGLPPAGEWDWVVRPAPGRRALGWRVLREGEVVRGEDGGTLQGL